LKKKIVDLFKYNYLKYGIHIKIHENYQGRTLGTYSILWL